MMLQPRVQSGKDGEDLVADYFFRQGYWVLGRNLRCRYGEIDLLVQRAETVVCVEIKTRAKAEDEVWSLAQQERLRRAAVLFFDQYGLLEHTCRFDLVTVWKVGEKWRGRHQKNVLTFEKY